MAKYKHVKTDNVVTDERNPKASFRWYTNSDTFYAIPREVVEGSADWKEVPDYLIVTEEGVGLNEGDTVYFLAPNLNLSQAKLTKYWKPFKGYKYFSGRSNAEAHIEVYKPLYNLEMITVAAANIGLPAMLTQLLITQLIDSKDEATKKSV